MVLGSTHSQADSHCLGQNTIPDCKSWSGAVHTPRLKVMVWGSTHSQADSHGLGQSTLPG